MRKICVMILVMLLLAVPCGAAQQESTPLQFGTPETIYGISAVYAVETENVDTVEVVFADSVKNYAYANYVNGELRISIASADPLDLSYEIGQISATLDNGTQTAPDLKLKSLKFNGKKATCNLIPATVTSSVKDRDLDVSVSVHNDFPIACKVMVAAFNDTHQMLGCAIQDGDSVAQDFSVQATLFNCAEAEYLKTFYLTETFQPIIGVRTAFINSRSE